MAGSVTFNFRGGKELEQALKALGDQKRMRAAARSALRKAAEPIVAQARALAPVDMADIKHSIKQGAGKKRRGADEDQVWQVVGIDRNEQPPEEVERNSGKGTYRDPGVAGVGPIQEFGAPEIGLPARPFMRPAWDNNKARSAVIIRQELGPAIERQAKAAARKAAKAK